MTDLCNQKRYINDERRIVWMFEEEEKKACEIINNESENTRFDNFVFWLFAKNVHKQVMFH